MALMNCDECNNQVSDKADKCPHCGAPIGFKSPNIKKPKLTSTVKYYSCRNCGESNVSNTITCKNCRTFSPNISHERLENLRKVAKVLGWIMAPSLLLMSAQAIVVSPFASVFGIGISIISFPYTRKLLKSKTKFIPNVWFTIILFFLGASFVGNTQAQIDERDRKINAEKIQALEKEKETKLANESEQKIAIYLAAKDSIWQTFKNNIEEKQFSNARAIVTRLNPLRKFNSSLAISLDSADRIIEKEEAKNDAPELLKQLKNYPSDEEAIKIYRRLVIAFPNNQKYANSVNDLQNKIEKSRKESEALSAAQEQVKNQFSPWDGSHRELEKYIKESMNDPSSYEHVSTKYFINKDHMIVITRFRGKNAFGGVVTNTAKAKVSLDGSSITIIE